MNCIASERCPDDLEIANPDPPKVATRKSLLPGRLVMPSDRGTAPELR